MAGRGPDYRPGVRKVIDWVFTIPFLVLLVLALVLCDPLFRLSRLFGVKSIGYLASAFMWMLQRLVFPINGTRTLVEKSPRVQPRTPYIVISNHQSLYEFPLFGTALFRRCRSISATVRAA